MKNYTHKSNYFYGHEVSDYGKKNGYIDYGTLSRAFDAVLCNEITSLFYSTINGEYNEPEQVNGFIDNGDEIDELREQAEEDAPAEIYQYFIISDNGARILQELTNEIVYYLPVLDVYIWCVTHWGTGWDYVLTDIKIELDEVEQ